MSNEEIKTKIIHVVEKYPVSKLSMFGSRASGTNRDNSDIDLIVEFSEKISLLLLSQLKIDIEECTGLSVDLIHGPIQEEDMIEVGEVIELYAAA